MYCHVCHFLRRYILCIHSLFVSIQLRKQNFLPPKLCFCCYLKLLSCLVYSLFNNQNIQHDYCNSQVVYSISQNKVYIRKLSTFSVLAPSLTMSISFNFILKNIMKYKRLFHFFWQVMYMHFPGKTCNLTSKKLNKLQYKVQYSSIFFLSFSSLFSKRLSIIHTHFLVALTLNLAYFGVVKKTISKFMEHNFSQYSHNLSQAHFQRWNQPCLSV